MNELLLENISWDMMLCFDEFFLGFGSSLINPILHGTLHQNGVYGLLLGSPGDF